MCVCVCVRACVCVCVHARVRALTTPPPFPHRLINSSAFRKAHLPSTSLFASARATTALTHSLLMPLLAGSAHPHPPVPLPLRKASVRVNVGTKVRAEGVV